jgi:anti-sigma-K factor RskA
MVAARIAKPAGVYVAMTDMIAPMPSEPIAAEFALGLLEGEALQAAHARIKSDPDFAQDVAAWQESFATLADGIKEVAPPEHVRKQLMLRLFGASETHSLWARVGLWQAISLTSIAAAAFFAYQSLTMDTQLAPSFYVTELAAENDTLRVLAVLDETSATLKLTRSAGQPAIGRAFELWAIVGETAPVSLGLLPTEPTAQITLPDGLRDNFEGVVLAISDEPATGSPSGQPTGAVLAVGSLAKL